MSLTLHCIVLCVCVVKSAGTWNGTDLLLLYLWLLTDQLRCKTDEFDCHNGRCLSLHALCDGEDNCGDGSDETSCQNCSTFSCGPSDVCLSRNKLCDGQPDCKDGRDESQELCGFPGPHVQTSTSCASFEFQCGNGQCISRSWQCDNMTDCSDGSDEKNCGKWNCLRNTQCFLGSK